MRPLALLALAGCGANVSDPIFETVSRAEVVPGEVRVDTGSDDTDTGEDTGEDTGPFTGGCLEFYGDPDYFGGGDAALPQGDTARTVEFWFRHSNNVGKDVVVGWGASGADFLVGFYNGFPMVEANGVAVYGSSNAVADGSWYHLAAIWDPSVGELSLWINAGEDGRQAATVSTSGGGVFWLGDAPTSPNRGDAYEGVIDEVHIWDRALSPGELGGLFDTAPAGMVAWYNMNQEGAGAGLTMQNLGLGDGLDLTSSGAPAFVPCKY